MTEKNRNIFISSDMEGIALTKQWNDVDKNATEYQRYAYIQSTELKYLIKTIQKPNDNIVIRDSHGGGNNIIPTELSYLNPTLLQNWHGANEFGMLSGLDNTFDFVILHGFHAAGGTKLSPLAHTFSHKHFKEFKLNGDIIGEVGLSMYTAAYAGVPVIMISGDSGAISEARAINPNILVVETKNFVNNKPIWMATPPNVNKNLYRIATAAVVHLERAPSKFYIELPKTFVLNMTYTDSKQATLQSKKIPEVQQIGKSTIEYKTNNFGILLKTLRQLKFLVK